MNEKIKPRVHLGQEYDGFVIKASNNGEGIRVRVDQEDTIYKLSEIFEFLGCEVSYEGVC